MKRSIREPGNQNLSRVVSRFAGLKMPCAFRNVSSSFFIFVFLLPGLTTSSGDDFVFNGFNGANLSLDGMASLRSNGLVQLTNDTHKKGHAFYPAPLRFRSGNRTFSFSTTFVFGIVPEVSYLGGNGIAFFISRTTNFTDALPSQYFGLFNDKDDGNSSNHVFAVELDTIQNPELNDIDYNHVGIDVNSLKSNKSHTAGYYEDSTGSFRNLSLISGQPMQLWIDYDGEGMLLNVTLSPVQMSKPRRPLLSSVVDLSSLMLDSMHVGFSSSTGPFHTMHFLLGWSFKMNGAAEQLDFAKLPSLPFNRTKRDPLLLEVSLPIASTILLLLIFAAVVLVVRTRKEFAELLEDWELEYGPHRFSYKALYKATRGFNDKELLGSGGFGRVYRGVLPTSKIEVAVKKISHESRQGMKEFVAEIVSIGKLRHRNLVQLLGYCRRRGELLLVYDFMPNGSLDRFLYDGTEPTLSWAQRFTIVKGVASCLLYLHEDWEQVVVHRDVKASNVLLDGELNGRLGDFGLARLYDHGTDPHTTHVVGTTGYIAPELSRTGKATTATDVFAFGVFLLEVVCGRRPVESSVRGEKQVLIGWVLTSWQRGLMFEVVDSRLREDYRAEEVELVLKLGLLCANPMPASRPSMRQVVQFLEKDVPLPELPPSYLSSSFPSPFQSDGYSSYQSSSSVSNFFLSGGR